MNCRRVLLSLLVIASPASAQTYPELTGMFSHAAGYVQSADGHLEWAWAHEGEAAGCSRFYFNSGRWFDWQTGGYDLFCVEGDWVTLKGWSSTDRRTGQVHFLAIRQADGTWGQKYAKVSASEAYAFSESATLWLDGFFPVVAYTDSQTWAPTVGGWSQTETFRYLSDIGAGCQFTATQIIGPRTLFGTVYQTRMDWDGTVRHLAPAHSVGTWTWP